MSERLFENTQCPECGHYADQHFGDPGIYLAAGFSRTQPQCSFYAGHMVKVIVPSGDSNEPDPNPPPEFCIIKRRTHA